MGLTCKNCGSEKLRKKWSWCRKRQELVNHDDSGLERTRFVSRSTKYICGSCGYEFMKVAKLYGDDDEPAITATNYR